MADIRFYVDADLLALGKSLVAARYDVTYPGDSGQVKRGRPECLVKNPATKDLDWIPLVAAQGWVVISRDRNIARKPRELRAVKEHGLRMVVVDSRRDQSTWGELVIVTTQWSRIEKLTTAKGPLLFVATRSNFRPVGL